MPELVWKIVTEADLKAAVDLSNEITETANEAKLTKEQLGELVKEQNAINAEIEAYTKANQQATTSLQTRIATTKELVRLQQEEVALLKEMAEANLGLPKGGSATLAQEGVTVGGPDQSGEYAAALKRMADEAKRVKDNIEWDYTQQFSKHVKAASDFQQMLKKTADEEIRLSSTLSPTTQEFIKHLDAVDKNTVAIGRGTRGIVALRQAMRPLATVIPGLGNSIAVFGGQFAAIAAPILIATTALKGWLDSNKQMDAILAKYEKGFDKPFTDSANAIRETMSKLSQETDAYTRSLTQNESALKRQADALESVGRIQDARDRREQNLEDKRKQLEIFKFRQKEKDPIKQMEGVILIEEKYERMKMQREDAAARRKASSLASKQFTAQVTAETSAAAAQRQAAAVASKATSADKSAATYEDAKNMQREANERLAALKDELKNFKTQNLLGLPTLMERLGVSNDPEDIANYIRDGGTKFKMQMQVAGTSSDYDRIKILVDQITDAEQAVKNAKVREKRAFETNQQRQDELKVAKEELERFRSEAKEAATQAKKLGENLNELVAVLKEEAAMRKQTVQFDWLIRRSEALDAKRDRMADEVIKQAKGEPSDVNLAAEGKSAKQDAKTIAAMEKTPLAGDDLWKNTPTIRPQLQALQAKLTETKQLEAATIDEIVRMVTGFDVRLMQLQKQIQNSR